MTVFTPEQIKLLEAKLDPKHVAQRSHAGRSLSYIEGWHAIAEANRIFGFDAWDRETTELKETSRDLVNTQKGDQWRVSYLAKVRISVGRIVREGTGYGSGMANPMSLGDAIESAAKEAETDAMKRALMTFGNPFGLALYDKTQANVGTDLPEHLEPTKDGSGTKVKKGWSASGTRSSQGLKESGVWDEFQTELYECTSVSMLTKLALAWSTKAEADKWPTAWRENAKEEINKRRADILNAPPLSDDDHFPGEQPNSYVQSYVP